MPVRQPRALPKTSPPWYWPVGVAVIKYSHHDFEIDRPGKDSYRLRKAGAQQMLIASPWRTALITEQPDRQEPELTELLTQLDRTRLDLVLVEGFRHSAFPKSKSTGRRPGNRCCSMKMIRSLL